jgi:hypothetical protein
MDGLASATIERAINSDSGLHFTANDWSALALTSETEADWLCCINGEPHPRRSSQGPKTYSASET